MPVSVRHEEDREKIRTLAVSAFLRPCASATLAQSVSSLPLMNLMMFNMK
jgi:hypothetical protein